MAELMSAIERELESRNVVSVKEVALTVGRLTNLGAEQLGFAYEVMSRGTVFEGSTLVIEEEAVRVSCGKCGYEGPAKSIDMGEETHLQIPVLSCPECGGAVSVTAGKSCCVRSIEIEEGG
ncbi:MAG: hydrogenase/urease maturation nickel metallochaperone HypA [Methanomassiliicoccaceae archaeon]|nr:hydrogenase/urease maturation nickel metallochaperone HypA [Methanomassiliicoccaceae archaeon]